MEEIWIQGTYEKNYKILVKFYKGVMIYMTD